MKKGTHRNVGAYSSMTPEDARIIRQMSGRSSLEIARAIGASPATALRWCRRLGVQTIGKGNRRPGLVRMAAVNLSARTVFEVRP